MHNMALCFSTYIVLIFSLNSSASYVIKIMFVLFASFLFLFSIYNLFIMIVEVDT